jgi:hypothetical protein
MATASDGEYYCPSPEKNQIDGTAMIQACSNILLIVINIILLVCVRPYRCLECKLEQLRLSTNKTEGTSVKLAMLSFEDVIEAKIKDQSHNHSDHDSSNSNSGSGSGNNKRSARRKAMNSGSSKSSTGRWKSAGARVKITNALRGDKNKQKWWEQDEYVSWHVRRRRQCFRGFKAFLKCQCFNGCYALCCGKKKELQGWEKCTHMSNTDQMEAGLLSIQLLMVGFGLGMLFVRRIPGNNPDETLTDSEFTVFDVITVVLILALCVPLFWSISITMKAMKAYKAENKDTKKTIKGNTCCGKWMRRIGNR